MTVSRSEYEQFQQFLAARRVDDRDVRGAEVRDDRQRDTDFDYALTLDAVKVRLENDPELRGDVTVMLSSRDDPSFVSDGLSALGIPPGTPRSGVHMIFYGNFLMVSLR